MEIQTALSVSDTRSYELNFSKSPFLLNHPVYYVIDIRTAFCIMVREIFTVTDSTSLILLAFIYYYTIIRYIYRVFVSCFILY
jgi:hypothetical protein